MDRGNNLLPRTWSTEAACSPSRTRTAKNDCPPSPIERTWSTEAACSPSRARTAKNDCPPSPIVSPVAPPVSPVSENKVSFDDTIDLLHYMVDAHMKSTKADRAAKKAKKANKANKVKKSKKTKKAIGSFRLFAPTRV